MKDINMLHIGLIDDHFVFAEGLKLLLEKSNQFSQVTIYPCPANANRYRLPTNLFDILVLDINIPFKSGFDICGKMKELTPVQTIILLSSRIDFDIEVKAKEAGADFFINKQTDTENLIAQIISTYKSEEAIPIKTPPSIQSITFQNGLTVRITERELNFLKLLTYEYTSKEIAEKMFVSEHTVIGYRKNLSKKLEVKNMIGLAKYSLELYPQSFY